MQNRLYFLDYLIGCGTKNVLFEPFVNRIHTETLIWRRGTHLWDTPEAYTDTLFALSRRTRSDVIFCDMRRFADNQKEHLFWSIEKYAFENVGFAVICDNEEDLMLADRCSIICAAAVYGHARSKHLPTIRMDGDVFDAIENGDSGWYAEDDAEFYLQKVKGKIRILGGLGRNVILNSSPVNIYATVERLAASYPGQWACGSGFEIPAENYLELISLLGAFGKIR